VLLPIITSRLQDGRHRVVIEAPIERPGNGTCHGTAPPIPHHVAERLMMEQFTALFEAHVRCHPEQWYWLHRSWRPAFPSVLR